MRVTRKKLKHAGGSTHSASANILLGEYLSPYYGLRKGLCSVSMVGKVGWRTTYWAEPPGLHVGAETWLWLHLQSLVWALQVRIRPASLDLLGQRRSTQRMCFKTETAATHLPALQNSVFSAGLFSLHRRVGREMRCPRAATSSSGSGPVQPA